MNIISVNTSDALVVIDVQLDFLSGGALEVPDSERIIAPINRLIDMFGTVAMCQDWHPQGHSSFASSHDGKNPLDVIAMPYGDQVLWPDHCIAGSKGAEFHPDLNQTKASVIVRKGSNPDIDSYSTFFENDQETPTGLAGYLRQKQVKRIFLVGLAWEYCVGFSATDGVAEGFEVYFVDDAVGCFENDAFAPMNDRMSELGVKRIVSADITA